MNHKKYSVPAIAAFIICAAFASAMAFPVSWERAIAAAQYAIDASFATKNDTLTAPAVEAPPAIPQAQAPPDPDLSSFTFMPPLGNGGGGNPAALDALLLDHLLVEICEMNGGECTIIRTFTSAGPGNDKLRITGNHFHVNWKTQGANPNRTRTVRVILAGLQLGSVTLSPGQYGGMGSTWPIKFRVERDPVIRIRLLRSLDKSVWQIVAALKRDFNLCGPETASLMAADAEPYPAEQVEQAISGVCQDVVVPDTTKVADEETAAVHTSYDPATGQMVFSKQTDLLRNMRPGDVFVSEPTAAAPYGFLRKITSTRKQASRVILETVQAKLTEAIYQGTLDVTGDLLPPNPIRPGLTGLKGAEGGKGPSIAGVVIDEGESFNFGPHRIDVTINFDGSEEGVEGSGRVRVVGEVFFDAGYNVGMGIRPCLAIPPACVDRFEAWAGAKQRSKLRVEGNFNGTIHKEKVVHPIPLNPIWVFIGPIPVVLVPEMNVILGVDGEAHVDFVFDGQANSTFKVGAKWLNPSYGGNGWNDISEYDLFSGKVNEASLNADMRLEAFAKLDAKIKLYGIVGPGMEGAVGIEADVATGRQPLWKVRGHVTSAAKFEIGLAEIIEVGVYREPILNEYFHIAESVNSPPVFRNVVTDVIPVSIQTPVTLGPRAGFSGYFDVSDPENDPISFQVNSSLDGPINLTHTFTTPGLRNITVTARDIHGASGSITLRVDVRNSLPIVNIFAGTTAEATVQFFMTAEAFDPDTNAFLPCSRIDWAAPPDTVTELNGGCSAVVKFTQLGTRTVTVTATDFNGGVGTKQIAVTVNPAPANLPPTIDADSLEIHASTARGGGPCYSGNGFCLVPASESAQLLWPGFGTQANDEWGVPLTMWVDATDPEGDPISYEWRCQVQNGTQVVIATHLGDGVFQCTPPYVPGAVIEVFATVSDGIPRPPIRTTPRIFIYRITPN